MMHTFVVESFSQFSPNSLLRKPFESFCLLLSKRPWTGSLFKRNVPSTIKIKIGTRSPRQEKEKGKGQKGFKISIFSFIRVPTLKLCFHKVANKRCLGIKHKLKVAFEISGGISP